MKKKLTITLVAEIEIDTDWYEDKTDKGIIETEKNNWAEWITGANLIKEEITLDPIEDLMSGIIIK
jgi:hypothetical protein